MDDNVDAADSTAAILRLEKYEVTVARGGSEALRLVETVRPHVVLLDVNMPEVSGYDVARSLRDYRSPVKAIIVGLSGMDSSSDRLAARMARFDYYLTKPVAPEALLGLLRRLSSKEER